MPSSMRWGMNVLRSELVGRLELPLLGEEWHVLVGRPVILGQVRLEEVLVDAELDAVGDERVAIGTCRAARTSTPRRGVACTCWSPSNTWPGSTRRGPGRCRA